MRRILVDTNIYSHAMAGREDACDALRQADEILLCPVVIGELLNGFMRGSRETENRRNLDQFINSPRVTLPSITDATAEFYASVLRVLQQNGTPIPTNDIWIAASALEHGVQVVTADDHFRKVSGLITSYPCEPA